LDMTYIDDDTITGNDLFASVQLFMNLDSINLWIFKGISLYAYLDLSNTFVLSESSFGVKLKLGLEDYSVSILYNYFGSNINNNPFSKDVEYINLSRFGTEISINQDFKNNTKLLVNGLLMFLLNSPRNTEGASLQASVEIKFYFNKNLYTSFMMLDNIYDSDPTVFTAIDMQGIYIAFGYEI